MSLPPHVAAGDEPIPPLNNAIRTGPDMRTVMPVAEMIADLRQHEGDVVSYVADWREHMTNVGARISASFERDGELQLAITRPCDSQIRHRSRLIHFLCEDLDGEDGRREWLLTSLVEMGNYTDNRPANPTQTTAAVRAYLQAQGRIMIDPRGRLLEGAEVPLRWLNGTDADAAECERATRVYNLARRRWRSEPQIRRAVRMLGRPEGNGWIVLEAQR
jgi:hypothetical protein